MKPGIHRNIPEAEYLALPYVSKSKLAYLMESPEDLRWALDHPGFDQSEAFNFGKAADTFVFSPAEFDNRIAVKPECNRTTKEGKAIFEAWCAGREVKWVKKGNATIPVMLGDRAIIDFEQLNYLPNMLRDLKAHEEAGPLLAGLKDTQTSIIWDDRGMRCRARLDALSHVKDEVIVWDYKTCADIRRIYKDALEFGYPIQSAMYQRGLNAFDGPTPKQRRFKFVFQQSTPKPNGKHPIAVIEYSQVDIDRVNAGIDGLLDLWRKCEDENNWPGPPYTPKLSAIPDYYFNSFPKEP